MATLYEQELNRHKKKVEYHVPKQENVNDSELKRLRKNLKQKIQYYNKKHGYNIDVNLANKLSVEQLTDLTTQELLDYATFREQETWEYEIFPKDVNMIINNFMQSYSKYNIEARNILDTWLNNLIVMKGEAAVAQMLQSAHENGLVISSNIIYGKLLDSAILDFMAYLPEQDQLGNIEIAELMDSIEELEDWGDIT